MMKWISCDSLNIQEKISVTIPEFILNQVILKPLRLLSNQIKGYKI